MDEAIKPKVDENKLQDQEDLLNPEIPLIFTDGTEFFKKLEKDYIKHKKGFFIMGPSGVGKSHFYRTQKEGERHWIDADRIWRWSKAMPKGAWWETPELIEEVEQKCDVITVQAKKMGFWLIGSANWWLKPDAIVIPHWRTHIKFIKKRELNFDGGARANPKELAQVLRHRKWILTWQKKGVPKFNSVAEATKYLESTIK